MEGELACFTTSPGDGARHHRAANPPGYAQRTPSVASPRAEDIGYPANQH
jgi:hypothetical protein